MIRSTASRVRTTLAAAVVVAVAGLAALATTGQAASVGDVRGSWSFLFEADVALVAETNIGVITFLDGGRCKLVMRTDVAGSGPRDNNSDRCTYQMAPTGIGTFIAILGESERAVFEFVVGDSGRRMYFMLAEPQGFPGRGQAVRQ